jgi:DNA-binding Lrp family transcriptional regulator
MADRSKHSADLDPVDRKILWVLCSDGRLTMNELAEKVGLSASPCWRRVKRVEENGHHRNMALLKHNAPV